MSQVRSLLLLGFFVVGTAHAILIPSNSLTSAANSTTTASSLSQLMTERTQQANKAFEHVSYKKMSGDGKASFFDNGGMGDMGGTVKFTGFRTQPNDASSEDS